MTTPTTVTAAWRPRVVGLVRAVLLAAAAAVLATVIDAVEVADLPAEIRVWAPVFLLVLRTLEGEVDDRRDPTPQAGLLGGKPAS